jgi:uncharacterized phage infection (PIP) family protein YhgE
MMRAPSVSNRAAAPLRTKLLIAFASVAFATAICGALSLLFVNRIGNAITVYADITSPLQTASAALLDTAQRMRSQVFKAVSNGDDPQTISTQLNLLDAVSQVQLRNLGVLADQAGIKIEFESVAQIEDKFTTLLHDIIEESRTVGIAAALNEKRRARFERVRRTAKDQLRAIVDQADGAIAEGEEKAKIDSQIGIATLADLTNLISELFTEITPRSRNAYKVMREIEQLDDTVKILATGGSFAISEAERTTNNTLKTIDVIMARLQGRLRDEEGSKTLVRLQQDVAELRESLLGEDGLIKGYGAMVLRKQRLIRAARPLKRLTGNTLICLAKCKRRLPRSTATPVRRRRMMSPMHAAS